MSILPKNYSKIIACSVLSFTIFGSGGSQAGLLKIVNDNPDEIAINIVADADSRIEYNRPTCWKCLAGTKAVGKPHQADIVLTSADLCGKKQFTVTGSTGGLFFNGECQHLSVLKNYEIHFLHAPVGTACFSKEI